MKKTLFLIFIASILVCSNAINLDKHDAQEMQYSNCEVACTRSTQSPVICGGKCCDFVSYFKYDLDKMQIEQMFLTNSDSRMLLMNEFVIQRLFYRNLKVKCLFHQTRYLFIYLFQMLYCSDIFQQLFFMNKLLAFLVIVTLMASQASAIDIRSDQENHLTFNNCELACTKQGGIECGGKCCPALNCKKNACQTQIAIPGCY